MHHRPQNEIERLVGAREPLKSSDRTRLLIASGDPLYARRLPQYFSAAGYAVETAQGGVECWLKLHGMQPHVLVLDQDLPWGGGAGVLACLRETNGHAPRMPVILLTSEADEPEMVPPVVFRLRKPVLFHKVLDAVQSAATLALDSPDRKYSIGA